MYTIQSRESSLEEFSSKADTGFAEIKSNLGIGQAMKSGNANAVRAGINSIKNLLVSVIPKGIAVPKAYLYITSQSGDGNAISMVTITVSNKPTSEKEFRFNSTILGEDVDQKAYSFLKSVYSILVEDEMAQVNVNHVNSVFEQAVKEADLPYSIKLATPLGNMGKKISYISDDEIVFVADSHRLFDIGNMIIFMTEPTELIPMERIQETYTHLVDTLAKAQTPIQLVSKHGGDLISLLCDISKRVKPMTLISKIYSRNILAGKSSKDGIGYYNKNNIFAVVSRKGDSMELVLKPINAQTMEPVDFDVLGDIQVAV